MEMDEDMEIEQEVFEVREIDPEYEFDAARWFDFTREESLAEAWAAELWFHTAPSYPPSPFVAKLFLREEVSAGEMEPSMKPEYGEATVDVCDSDIEAGQHPDYLAADVDKRGNGMLSGIFTASLGGNLEKVPNQPLSKGLTFSNHVHTDKLKSRPKSSVKPVLPRSSTLMKPTASQLAKQNHARLQKQVDQIHDKGFCSSSGSEIQAAKRQKLEGGLLRKVADMKQELSFIHKAPKKDETLDRNSHHARMKITIPQEPDLVTAQRAQRAQMAQRIRPKNETKLERDSTAVHRFRARPLNRKIFEAPSLPIRKKSTPKLPEFHEFHLKTSERAMQYSSAVTMTSYQYNDSEKGSEKHGTSGILDGVNRESRRPSAMDVPKQDVTDGKYVFRARPLNKKILSSKGDIGVFRNSKREATVPLEFNFHSEKRVQPNLPIDLFNKLSITSELQPNNESQSRFTQPTPVLVKGSKENRIISFQSGNEIVSKFKGKPSSAVTQIQCGNSGIIPEANQQWTPRRSFGIR